jgi:tetratricopeptide (TPR) repeat protein
MAVKGLLACIAEDHGNPDYYETLGLAYRLGEDLDSAIRCYQQGLQLGVRKAFFHRYLGEIYRMKHEDDKADTHFLEAADAFKKVLKVDPKNVEAMEQLADIYSKMKWFEESLDIYKQLLKRFPYNSLYRRDIGGVLYELDLLDDAEKNLLESLRLSPGEAPALLFLGLVYFKKRLLGLAVQTLSDCLKSNPDQPEVEQLISQIDVIRGEIGKTVEEIIYDPCPHAVVEGHVKWYNPESGMGALTCPEYPEVLLHFSALTEEVEAQISKGAAVRFGVVKDKLSPIAVQVEIMETPEELDTEPGKIEKFDSERRIGVIKNFEGREVMFSFSVLADDVIENLEVGLDVLYESKPLVGLSDKPVEQAVRVRLRKKRA